MKKINIFLSLIISILFVVLNINTAFAGGTYITVGDYNLSYNDTATELIISEYIGTNTATGTPGAVNNVPVTTVGSYAYVNNTKLLTINIAKSITKIDDYAFTGCSSLDTVNFKGTINTLGKYAFNGCSKIKNVNLEDSKIKVVSEGTFLNAGIEKVELPDTCEEIASKAFMQCTKLSYILIPRSVEKIASDAFDNSKNVVISCYKDSCAHKYAVENNIKYKLLYDPQPTEPITETETVTQPVTEPVKETFIVGDVNDDKSVTITDATMIQQVIAKLISSDEKMEQRGDTSFEGIMSISDVTRIQQYLASIEVDVNHVGETREYK